tara:strand:+ start:189 stop:794 length:606 start_codon:yes stop_codon:yes gene_type:complete
MIIIASFVIITSLILWFVIGSRGMWGPKAVTIAFALYFCLSISFSLQNFEGWPSDASLPEEFRVHWIIVEEPDKRGGEGAVYIWAEEFEPEEEGKPKWWLSFQKDDTDAPRAYRLPYNRDLHEQSQEALERLMAGEGVMGRNDGDGGHGKVGEAKGEGSEGPSGEHGNADAGGQGDGSLTKNGGITFQKLPTTKLPEKIER